MAQSYTHALEFTQGWFDQLTIQVTAKKSANVTFTLKAGRVVHQNSAGDWETGAAGIQLPFLLMGSEDALDVTPIDSTALDVVQGTPLKELDAVCVTNALEVSTTEYDTAQTYVINQLLRAAVANTTLATGGVLTNQGVVWATSGGGNTWTTTVGFVSVAPAKRIPTRIAVLRFFTHLNVGAV